MPKEIEKKQTKRIEKISLFSLETGKKIKTITVPDFLKITVSAQLIYQVLNAHNTKLLSSSHTKTRAEVRGGGCKPFRQKGTGKARAGSIRSPLWKGGGIIFGPSKFENKVKNVSKKMKRNAILGLLADKIKNNKVIVIDKLDLKKSKTKEAYAKLFVFAPKVKSLLILATAEINKIKPFRNIENFKYTKVENINIYDLFVAQSIIFTKKGFKELVDKNKIKI